MTPKSMVYMVVAVFVGYMLVSAVPGQMAMYTAPTSGQQGDTITITGSGFSPENESLSVEENGTVRIYWDSVNTTEGGHGLWTNNESISLEVEGSDGSPSGSVVIVEGHGFSPSNESSGDIVGYSEEIEAIADSVVESGEISDIAAEADEAVEVAEAAADAVSSVASNAGEASEAAADAAEAASALKSASSGLYSTIAWLTVDVLIALVVYWFARRRFA